MKGKALGKHSLHEKTAASVLLKLKKCGLRTHAVWFDGKVKLTVSKFVPDPYTANWFHGKVNTLIKALHVDYRTVKCKSVFSDKQNNNNSQAR